ncbi:MAG: NAD-dependent epimerase [Pelodictyon luteolum]|uniref:NAD-dependent epimerase n=1 Tax=Pelodictyon luteolum TaxID=1100 RepID=A0A165M1E8_PELLU|nr:SDR family oxidoreductase [Pelodictyon luteolum]KZK74695.1 MAG: NAD-dependent epimerase [Pelodictyon luteolum]
MDSRDLFSGRVLVAGASGRTGNWVVKRLRHYNIPVRALVRSRDRASGFDADVEIAVGTLQDRAALDKAVAGCTGVISAVGSSSLTGDSSPSSVDRDGVIRLAEAALAAGVKHFGLVSSLAVTRWYHPLNLFGGVLSMKFAAEEHIRKIFSQNGRSYTIVRPGGLKDGEPLQHTMVVGQGDHMWSGWTNRSDVAELLVLSLWLEKARNRTFEVVSGEEHAQDSLEYCYDNLS